MKYFITVLNIIIYNNIFCIFASSNTIYYLLAPPLLAVSIDPIKSVPTLSSKILAKRHVT